MEYGCSRKDMRILINPTPREDKRVARISAATSETVHVSPGYRCAHPGYKVVSFRENG